MLRLHGSFATCLLCAGLVLAQGTNSDDTVSLKGHEVFVTTLMFSPDGKTLVTAGHSDLKWWDMPSGKLRAQNRAHLATICSVAFPPRGDYLVSIGNHEAELRFWNPKTQKLLKTVPLPSKGGSYLTFNPNGKLLAIALYDNTVIVYDTGTDKRVLRLKRGEDGANAETNALCLAFSPDGKMLAASGIEGTANVWDMPAGKQRYAVRGHGDTWVKAVAFSPDGKTLATGGKDGNVVLWDARTGEKKRQVPLRRYMPWVTRVVFTRDGARLLVGGFGGTLYDCDLRDHDQKPIQMRGHHATINCLALSPDGKYLATASDDRTAKLWKIFPTPKR